LISCSNEIPIFVEPRMEFFHYIDGSTFS
jgi:hypothetical protein